MRAIQIARWLAWQAALCDRTVCLGPHERRRANRPRQSRHISHAV